jgi:hypothetical protein
MLLCTVDFSVALTPAYNMHIAGDVLFNPPWWWHAIKNVTPTSVGVASRWHTDGICGKVACLLSLCSITAKSTIGVDAVTFTITLFLPLCTSTPYPTPSLQATT